MDPKYPYSNILIEEWEPQSWREVASAIGSLILVALVVILTMAL